MIASVEFDTVERSHGATWNDPEAHRRWYRGESEWGARHVVREHDAALKAGGIVITDRKGPPAAFTPCTICGKRTCPSVTVAYHKACTDPDRKARKPRPVAWRGSKPTVCENPGCYGVRLTHVFFDGVLPDGNGHTHGLFCELCALTRRDTRATRYTRAKGRRNYVRDAE